MIFFLCIWAISTLGFFALASSMSKHQKQFFSRELSQNTTRIMTFLGCCGLALSFILCLADGTPSNNISYWIGVLTFAALFVGLCLSYYAQHFKKIVAIVSVIFIFSGLFIVF